MITDIDNSSNVTITVNYHKLTSVEFNDLLKWIQLYNIKSNTHNTDLLKWVVTLVMSEEDAIAFKLKFGSKFVV